MPLACHHLSGFAERRLAPGHTARREPILAQRGSRRNPRRFAVRWLACRLSATRAPRSTAAPARAARSWPASRPCRLLREMGVHPPHGPRTRGARISRRLCSRLNGGVVCGSAGCPPTGRQDCRSGNGEPGAAARRRNRKSGGECAGRFRRSEGRTRTPRMAWFSLLGTAARWTSLFVMLLNNRR